ncbi:hypothetical protein LCGC14_1039910 [marine sediment metagenome]|uniref:Uncharacterized protein n=1 Tax=marine sediment metagenome TaxID=412755 RepID=A0A0F9QY79_9ZZZZ
MPLTVANLTVVDNTALTQYSLETSSTLSVTLPINEPGKLIELHQVLYSGTVATGRTKLGQENGLAYILLKLNGVTAIFANFSNAPLVFPGVGEHLYVYAFGQTTLQAVTVWYRLIDAP